MSRLTLLALGLAVCVSASSTSGYQPLSAAPRVIHLIAERFSFTPSNITVEKGTSIELRITSEDTAHGFKLQGPGNIDVEIPKRGRGDRRVAFTLTEVGTYTFECSRVCGAGHGFMRGAIHVKAKPVTESHP